MKRIELTGKTFGRWTVLAYSPLSNKNDTRWLCRCECGKEKEIASWSLRTGGSQSCGCWHLDLKTTHGKANTPMWAIHNCAKSRSKKKGIPFDLQLDKLIAPEKCPLLGIPLFHTKGSNGKANSPSLDRLDPNKGYTEDNTWIISWRANTIKNNATLEELQLLTQNLENKLYGHNSNSSQNQ